jgi:hypothetical protein
VRGAKIGRETIGGTGIGTMIVLKGIAGIGIDIQIAISTTTGIGTMIMLKRKAGIKIDVRIEIIAIPTTITVMTEETVPASTVSTRRVTGVPTKKEANRIAAVWTI